MGLLDKLKGITSGILGPKQAPDKKPDNSVYSVLNLHKSTSTGDLIQAHNSVQLYYQRWMTAREYYHDFMHPDSHWTAEERVVLAKKKKAAIAFSKMISSWRTYIGSIIQNKYDIKPAPIKPTDQDLSDVYVALYHHTAFHNQTSTRDIDMLSESWIGGNSWQESFVEQTPGREPVVRVKNQNNFAIYPDPNRRDLVTNWDCKFIDRVGWYSIDDLISAYPDKEEQIRESLTSSTSIYYQEDKAYADRQHEYFTQKNGRYKVIERFYKVYKRQFFAVNEKQNRQDLGYDLGKDAQSEYKSANPNHQLFSEPEEFLYIAVCCVAIGEYLYNGEYSLQPKDPVSGKIMFTLYELIDEDIGGIPSGHAEHMVGPNKVVDALVVNMLAQAKNAAGVSHIGDPDSFDESAQIDIAKNNSEGDRVFWLKKNAANKNPLSLVPQGTLTADTDKGISFAAQNLEENSSTPPALQGTMEATGISGTLNEQRIQQASIQSQVQTVNYMNFLTQRAKLWMFFWNECFTSEMVIENAAKKDPNDPAFITVNQLVQDEWGGVDRVNKLQHDDAYKIVFEDSFQSPTKRAAITKQMTDLLKSPGIANDPLMTALVWEQILSVTDAPQQFKTKANQILEQRIQQASQPPAPPPEKQQKPSVSLALKGDLHDPETLQFLEAIGELPPGFGAEMATSSSAQVKQQGDIADVHAKKLGNHAKVLDNHSKMQDMADSEAQATTPNPTQALQPA